MKSKLIFLSAAFVAAAAASPVYAQPAPAAEQTQLNRDINGTEVRNFDQFLDSHPKVAQHLAQNPALVNNVEFIENHPALRDFLGDHPGVREELHESPGQFMWHEGHFEWREERAGMVRNDATMDGYFDHHPEVLEQLRANPSVLNNHDFLEDHPEVAAYLRNHPEFAERVHQNPQAFMNQQRWFDRHDGREGREGVTGREVSGFDSVYLDHHPEVAEALGHNPKLLDDNKWLGEHPQLAEYIRDHPEAREQLRQRPYRFMHREGRHERREDSARQ